MRWEKFGEGVGSATIVPDSPVVADTSGMWKIIYRAGPKGIAAGGCIRVTIPYGFLPPQISYQTSIGYTIVKTSNPDVRVSISLGKDPVTGAYANGVWGVNVFLTVFDHPLNEGETVTLVYGSTEHSMCNVGAFAQYFEQEVEYTVAADPDGKRSAPRGGFFLLKGSPKIRVINDTASQIIVVVPSETTVGEPFDVKVTVRDRHGNVVYDYDMSVEVDGSSLVHNFRPEDKGSYAFHGYVLNSPGTYRIRTAGSGGITGISNATLCTESKSEQKTYWGDIHVMTIRSAGLGLPDEAYEYGRRYSHLDFCAVTDGDQADSYLSDEEWEDLKKVVRKHHKPGSFVTFLAYECHERRFGGDKNVYYLDDEAPLIRWSDLPEPGEPTQLWEALKGQKAITVPHHTIFNPARFRTWEYYSDEYQRLVEIYSIWGCSEMAGSRKTPYWPTNPTNSVQSALNKGHRLGIIASSDSHEAHAGYSDWLRIRKGYHGGLVAVLAKELTREAVFDALWNRRCYGTTGERIVLDFSLNGYPMGKELCGNDHIKTRKISVSVSGTAPIERIDIVRNGVDVYTHMGGSADEEFDWEDTEDFDDVAIVPEDGRRFIYYYVRVTQEDDEMAWSSPIWVSY